MKRKTSKELLVESFREIVKKKAVSKITVLDIATNCGYSTTTFYRHFEDKFDLNAWDYSRKHLEIMKDAHRHNHDWKKTMLDGSLLFHEEREYFKNLLINLDGLVSFSQSMKKIHFESLKKCLLEMNNEKDLDLKTKIYLNFYCQGTVELTCDWIMGKYNISPKEMAEIYENVIPGPLYRYFFDK